MTTADIPAPASRNAPCPCGSGLRYKDCHGKLAGAGTTASAPAPDPVLARRMTLLQQALAAQQAGRLSEAIPRYEAVLAEDPSGFDALHMLGVALYQQHDFGRAEQLLRRAIAINGMVPAAQENLALLIEAHRLEHEAELLCRVVSQRAGARPAQLARASGSSATLDDLRVIAFYLPQFHRIAQNDRWWGEGFTEWTNVRKAQPNFVGHYQPHVPAELGYYDLMQPDVREAQAALARAHGVHGFCYYYYWFNGTRLLERPLEAMIASRRPDLPFCVCWANENWTRRWDGLDHEVLMQQHYSLGDSRAFFSSLLPLFRDRRYIHVNQRPLLLIYKAALIPDLATTIEMWREQARAAGLPGVYLAACQTVGEGDPVRLGFDAAVEFPPHGHRIIWRNGCVEMVNPQFQGIVTSYTIPVVQSLERPLADFKLFRTVMPTWDNTARRQNAGTVFVDSSPELFEYWAERIAAQTRERFEGDERLMFVNAWNEWGEGCHLEPDQRHGRQYLEALANGIRASQRASGA